MSKTTKYPALTPREQEILELIWDGLQSKAIGHKLALSTKTIDLYRGTLMEKLCVSNVAQLLRAALENALITLKGAP